MKVATALVSSVLLTAASAHTIFTDLLVGGQANPARFYGMRLPTYDGPITDVTSSAMACNGGPNPLTVISDKKITVAAGSSVTLKWAWTLDTDTSSGGMVIDSSHMGPVMVYMAKVSDSVTSPPPANGWFKIYEDGLNNGVWAVKKLIDNKGAVSVSIPSCIPPGDYLLRGELIALHAAGTYPGAQLYMECAQLTVTGGGSASPSTVSFPGAYKGSDPGITYNLYSGQTTYQIPGPRPFTCGGSNPPPATTTTAQQPRTTTTTQAQRTTTTTQAQRTTTTTTVAPQTTGSSGSCTNQKYAQCGGQGYSGPTCCVGSTCTFSNQWYSQCL